MYSTLSVLASGGSTYNVGVWGVSPQITKKEGFSSPQIPGVVHNFFAGVVTVIALIGSVVGFESRSSRHARDLGQVLHLQLPVALRRVNSYTVLLWLGASLSSTGLKEAL